MLLEKLLFHGPLSREARGIVAAAGLMLFFVLTLPLWQMTMVSREYPEGLRVWIYPNRLEGDLQEVNALNHYVGMGALDAVYFPELQILPISFAIGGLMCLLAATLRYRWVTTEVLLGGGLAGATAMGILIYRLYTYGHQLDPQAPGEIAPFMPPPIGVNQLDDVRVTTFFHLGSFVFVLALLGLMWALWISRPEGVLGKSSTMPLRATSPSPERHGSGATR